MNFNRRVLSALGKDLLLEIGSGLELDVTTRMGVRDALAKSKRAKLDAIVQESPPRSTLKEICDAVGLDDTGKEKSTHVERILAAASVKTANGVGYTIDPSATKASTAAEGGAAFGARLPRLLAHIAIKDAPLGERVVTITEDAQAHVVHTSRRRNGGFARVFHDLEMMERFGEGGLLPQAGGAA